MANVNISISAEPVVHLGTFVVTNSMLASLVVSALLVLFALGVRASLKSNGKVGRFQMLAEFIIEALNNLITSIAGTGRRAIMFTPIIMTFFLFILLNNWLGLIPGVGSIGYIEHKEEAEQITAEGKTTPAPEKKEIFVPYLRAGTADLNMTLALALLSVAMTQIYGFTFQKFAYFSKFINLSNPLNFFVGILETVSEFAKIVSFAFRLFGNIFAGEVLLAVMTFLVPLVIPMPFYGLELFVGFIQALVFSMLSLVFFNMATISHHDEH